MNPKFPTSKSGFSLIETVLALGIMGLAITALLGLLPHGIEMSKKAGNAAAYARIVDTVSSRLSNMPFPSVDNQNEQRMLFDDQGVQLANSGAGGSSLAAYVARVIVYDASSGMLLPGGSTVQSKLRRVAVQIAANPNLNFQFDGKDASAYETVPLLIGPWIP